MEASAGTAFVDFRGDFSSLNKQVAAYLGPLTSKFGKLGAAGAAGLGVVTGGAVAAGAALYNVGEEFDQAYDTIRVKTGATGKHLEGLKRDFKEVVQDVPADFGEAGTAVAELNQRLGLTGKPLQNVSKRVLELSRLTETDLSGNIASVTRLFADWSVKTAQQPATLDKLWRASQATGIEIGKLSEYMVQFGSPLRQMGFDFDTAAAMFSKFEKEGVNLQTAMPGLRMALKNFASEGKDPAKALEATIQQIKSAGSTAEANTMAFEIFGTRAGPDLAAAIREGRFNFAELIHTIAGGKDTIMGAAKDTEDFAERWQLFKNQVMVGLEPLASGVFGAVGDEMERITAILTDPRLSNEQKFSRIFSEISDQATDAFSEVASQAGHYAPQAALAFVHGFLDADAWGKLVIGALIVRRLGGFGALGQRLGMDLGGGIATGTERQIGAGSFRTRLKTNLLGIAKGVGFTMGAIGITSGIAEGVSTASRGGGFKETLHDSLTGALSAISFGALDPLLGKTFSETWDAAAQKVLRDMGKMPEMFKGGFALSGLGPAQKITAEQYAELMGLPGADDWSKMTDDQQKSFRQVFRSLHASAALFRHHGVEIPINVTAPQPAKAFKSLGDGFTFLKRGIGANMADINRVITRNFRLARTAAGGDMQAFRKLTAENMRAAATAIEKQMDRSGNRTKEGMQRIARLIRNANLIAPSRDQAQGFGREWAKGMDRSRDITRQGIQAMIAEAKKMPGPMRQVALQTWLEQIKQAKRSGDITVGEFRRMRSRVLSEFGSIQQGGKQQSKGLADGVIGNVSRLVNTTGSALGVFRDNVNAALKSFGVEAQEFTIKTVDAAGGGEARRQTGGIVPGSGDGDRPGFAAKAGSFVLNREATKAYGFRSGGIVPVALEAGERVFDPGEVQSIGRGRLEAMNSAVPRFQTGGSVGGPEPRITGPDPLRALGQQAMHQVYEGGKDYLRKHLKTVTGGDIVGVGHSLQRLGYEISEHPAFGGVHPVHVSGSDHYSGHAIDVNDDAAPFGHGASEMASLDWLAPQLDKLPHRQIIWRNHDWDTGAPVSGHMDHLHFAMQLGGLIEALAGGGVVGEVGSILMRNSLDLVSSAGILGNAWRESRWDPSAVGTGGGGLWGFTTSPISLEDLKAYAASQGAPWTDELAQTQFMLHHLPNSMRGAMNAMGDVEGTTTYFMNEWEKPGVPALDERIDGAKKALKILDGSGGAGGVADEKVPAEYHGAKTGTLSFGSTPKSLSGVEKELRQRRAEARRYRAAARAAEGKPQTQQAIQHNVTALEGRIRELERARADLRRAAAQKKFTKKLGRKLAKLTGFENLIAGRERAFDIKNLFAEQLVDTEPLAPELPASATDAQREAVETQHVADLTRYIEGPEKQAFGELLGLGGDWRNTILEAERAAAGNWQAGKGIGGLEGGWESDILSLANQIEHISSLPSTHTEKWWHDHPKALKHMHEQLAKLPMLRFKERELRKVLGEAREQFYPGGARVDRPAPPLAGSGAFEDALVNVQGVHWPDQHEMLGSIPGKRVPGFFGGVLWDVQGSLEGLGLKVSEAATSIGGGGSGADNADNSEYTRLLEELLAKERGEDRLRQIEERVFGTMPPYAGKAHQGAIVPGPPGAERTMIVQSGEGILPESKVKALQSIAESGSSRIGPPAIEELHVYPDAPPKMRFEGEDFDLAVTKVNKKEGRREVRGAGRKLARPGVFAS